MFFLFDPVLQVFIHKGPFFPSFLYYRIYDKAYNRQATLYPDGGDRSILAGFPSALGLLTGQPCIV